MERLDSLPNPNIFTAPMPPNPHELQPTIPPNEEARQAIESQAHQLQANLIGLRNEFAARGIEPEIEVVSTAHQKPSLARRLGRGALLRDNPAMETSDVEVQGRGWVISRNSDVGTRRLIDFTNKFGERNDDLNDHDPYATKTIILMEDGSLVMASAGGSPAEGSRGELSRTELLGEIDLQSYPFFKERVVKKAESKREEDTVEFVSSDLLSTEKGYANIYTRPAPLVTQMKVEYDTVERGVTKRRERLLVQPNSPEARVAMNLEHIMEDARRFGRDRLGIEAIEVKEIKDETKVTKKEELQRAVAERGRQLQDRAHDVGTMAVLGVQEGAIRARDGARAAAQSTAEVSRAFRDVIREDMEHRRAVEERDSEDRD